MHPASAQLPKQRQADGRADKDRRAATAFPASRIPPVSRPERSPPTPSFTKLWQRRKSRFRQWLGAEPPGAGIGASDSARERGQQSAEFTFFGPGSVRQNSFPLTAPGQCSQQQQQQQLLRCFQMQIRAPSMKEPKAFSSGLRSAQGTRGAKGRTPVLNPPRGCAVLRAQSKLCVLRCFPEPLLRDVVRSLAPKPQHFCQLLVPLRQHLQGRLWISALAMHSPPFWAPPEPPRLCKELSDAGSFTPSLFYVSPQNLPSKAEPGHVPGLQGLEGTGQSP